MRAAMPDILQHFAGRRKAVLYGEMGAGKTTFVKMCCQFLGVRGSTASPTFSLVNEYFYENGDENGTVRHLDLYRLKNLGEALDIGIEDFLEDKSFVFIEWPQIVEPILPEGFVKIEIKILSKNKRELKLDGGFG